MKQQNSTQELLSTNRLYQKFQTSRQKSIETIENDLVAVQEQQIHDAELKLRELIMELNFQQSEVENQKRKYIKDKAFFETSISQVKTEAESKSAKIQSDRLKLMSDMESDFMSVIQSLSRELSLVQPLNEGVTFDFTPQKNSEQSKYEATIQMFLGEENDEELDPSIDDNIDQAIDAYNDKIRDLHYEKLELENEIKDQDEIKKSQLLGLTVMQEDQNDAFSKEIEELQLRMKQEEESYKNQLDSFYDQIDIIIQQREDSIIKLKAKQDAVQYQIDALDEEFRQKLNEANGLTEKLKIALKTCNARKQGNLLEMKRRNNEFQKLIHDEIQLKQQIATYDQYISKLRGQINILRRELISKVGARRAISILSL